MTLVFTLISGRLLLGRVDLLMRNKLGMGSWPVGCSVADNWLPSDTLQTSLLGEVALAVKPLGACTWCYWTSLCRLIFCLVKIVSIRLVQLLDCVD